MEGNPSLNKNEILFRVLLLLLLSRLHNLIERIREIMFYKRKVPEKIILVENKRGEKMMCGTSTLARTKGHTNSKK
jgi:hypothetical protein